MGSPWPFVGRRKELDHAVASARAGRGVLVVGPSGVGKSAFVEALVARLDVAETCVIRVVGHALYSTTAYASLPWAFEGHAEQPALPGQVAARMAAALTGAGPRVLLVDDLPLVDEHTGAVIAELAIRHRLIVLATAQDLSLPEGGGRLWREGYVDRLELSGLTDDDVGEFLETGLGGPVAISTVLTFARRSQGNPLVLRELVVAAVESNALAQVNGWRLVQPAPVGSGARELIGRRLDGVGEPERAALELIAATEPILLRTALALTGPDMLDRLESEGLVAIRVDHGGAEVSTAHPLFGEILREAMPFVRLRRHRLDAAREAETSVSPRPIDLVRAALWRLEDSQPQDPQGLLRAARAARGTSLDLAEQLARQAIACGGGVAASVLLAQILIHAGRQEEAAEVTARLPPASLSPADREAVLYCSAMGQGLAVGDTTHGVELVARLLAGDPNASADVRALQASLLAFDARHEEALDSGRAIVEDPTAPDAARAIAAIGVVGAEYWLGRLDRAARYGTELAPVLRAARESVPYAGCSVELISVCALLDLGDHLAAERRARAMRERAVAERDEFALPRGDYLLARVELYRGQAGSAVHRLRRCVASLSRFDQFAVRHIAGVLARAEAESGDLDAADEALAVGAAAPLLTTYEPEWQLARAAVLAARLSLGEAADLATWAASMAADQSQWAVAVQAHHDAARYGAARSAVAAVRRLPEVASPLLARLVQHVTALAAGDGAALDAVSEAFEGLGAAAWAREAAAEAARAHAHSGTARATRASAVRAVRLGEQLETPLPPWLVDLGEHDGTLTGRERQVALLAAAGLSDKDIADRLGVSARTVSTHLSRCYAKLGVTGRAGLSHVLREASA